MTISVIMLTYNREVLVPRAIESILSQTFTDFEFVIINNGSCDKSGLIAEDYATKDNRVRVIHKPHGNIGSGRNVGLDAAKGKFIAFIDDDDWCEPDFLHFLYDLLINDNADLAICGNSHQPRNEKHIMNAEDALIRLMWRSHYTAGFPTKLFRRELIEDLRFNENGTFDDISLMYRLLARANIIAYHGLPKYHIYRHDGNNSAWNSDHRLMTPEILDEYLNVYNERTAWLCENFPDSTSYWRYFRLSFMLSMVEKISLLGIKKCESQKSAMAQEMRENMDAFIDCGFALDFEHARMEKYIKNGVI